MPARAQMRVVSAVAVFTWGVCLACRSADAPKEFEVGGVVQGLPPSTTVVLQDNGGDDLTVSADGPFTFATRLTAGSAYAVTVRTAPVGHRCEVAHGTGTIGGDVSDVLVTCAPITYAVGGTVRGLAPSTTVVLQDNGGDDLTVSANGPFTFATRLTTGSAYAVTVRTQPSGGRCTVKGSGTVEHAPVTSVGVVCATDAAIAATVLQRWAAPAVWGQAWPDGPGLLQHAWFDATTIAENGRGGIAWAWRGAFQGTPVPEPPPRAFSGFPGGVRHAGGPFLAEGERYEALSGDAALDLAGDMLVCAVVRPYHDPVHDGREYPILAKGLLSNPENVAHGGWVLAQSHESLVFSYQATDDRGNAPCAPPVPGTPQRCTDPSAGCSHKVLTYVPTRFASGGGPGAVALGDYSPSLNTSHLVVCAGRDGDTIRLAVNDVDVAMNERDIARVVRADCPGRSPSGLDADRGHHATIGGFAVSSASQGWTDAEHVFPGGVFETAVWAMPATVENLRAKLAAVQGLVAVTGQAPATIASYVRHREGPYASAAANHATTWRHAPRLDATKGQLFGLQSWNRVSFWMPGDASHAAVVFAAGEDLRLWTRNGGAAVAGSALRIPGEGVGTAQLVTLPPGASISITLDRPFDNPGCASDGTGCAPAGWPASAPFGPRRHAELAYPIWDAVGPIQGQLWVRTPTASSDGVLRVRYEQGTPDPANRYDIDLSRVGANAWKRVYLFGSSSGVGPGGGLRAQDTATRGTLFLENPGATTISFHAWGVQLTQLGGGGDDAFARLDPGVEMYDWSAAIDSPGETGAGPVTELSRALVDTLQLAALPADPAGFCLAADARPAARLPWDATMRDRRTLAAWTDGATSTASLHVNGTAAAAHPRQLCFELTGAMAGLACAPVPATWAPGSAHVVKGCVSPAGQITLYDGDLDAPLATASGTGALPGLSDGHLLVGNAPRQVERGAMSPWNGYVSQALICGYGDPDACQ